MRNRCLVAGLLVAAVLLTAPTDAQAQYKNFSFGFHGAFNYIWAPSVLTGNGDVLALDNRPVRLQLGGGVGGEINWKLSEDHWWLNMRVNWGFAGFVPAGDPASSAFLFDSAAHRTLGLIMVVQPQFGVRYVFMTDRVRPYIGASLSYLHLFSFSSQATATCSALDTGCSGGGESNTQAYLSHENVGGFHVQPGIEWIFTRDIAFHAFIDIQLWLVINATPNISFTPSFGIIFFT